MSTEPTYVFPLLFFKRISDVHDEEYAAALSESGNDQQYALFPQHYRFQIPDDCHWADVRVVTTNVGQALQRAMHGIEKANPETLYGIFGDAQRGDLWHVLPDTEAPWVADGERSGGCRDHTSRPRVSGQ
jgi:type I restriction-modification system DNA methylase subunit